MSRLRTITADDPRFPPRLRELTVPPRTVTIEGGPLVSEHAIAIVGAREATPDAVEFATDLAASIASAGAVVVSGGAAGIDTAAHRGALAVGGRTWAVAPTGRGKTYPEANEDLFAAIAASEGAMIWPAPDGMSVVPGSFQRRNSVLAALADVLVVVQADARSGALNAAAAARRLGRPVWAAPGPPWRPEFVGCLDLLERHGARMLTSKAAILRACALEPQLALFARRSFDDPVQTALFEACAAEPRHVDEIALRARVCASAAATGLLTLALENVLVEGPGGFYRRAN